MAPKVDKDNRVTEGPYKGEIVSPCDDGSETARIPGVVFSADEAQLIRQRMNLPKDAFHLDASSEIDGVYCMAFKNPAQNKYFAENFDCKDLDEGQLAQFWGNLPFTDKTRCQETKRAWAFFVPAEQQTLAGKAGDALIYGGGFAVSAFTVDRAAKKFTGRSILDRLLKNGVSKAGPAAAVVVAVGVATFSNGPEALASTQNELTPPSFWNEFKDTTLRVGAVVYREGVSSWLGDGEAQ